jgi:hypothetical protein
MSLAEKVGR